MSLSHLFPKIVIRRGVEKLTQTAIGRSLKKHLQCQLSQVVTPLITRPSRECGWGFAWCSASGSGFLGGHLPAQHPVPVEGLNSVLSGYST